MSQQPQRKKGRPDALLLILVIFLAVFGLVFLYSASSYNGRVRFHDSFYYFKNSCLQQPWDWQPCMWYRKRIIILGFACSGCLSDVCCSVYGCSSGGTGDQWIQKMAEPGTSVFSAFRICKSGSNSFSCMAD